MEVAAATVEVRSEVCIHRHMATMVITDTIRDQEVVVVDRVRRVLAIATRWFFFWSSK